MLLYLLFLPTSDARLKILEMLIRGGPNTVCMFVCVLQNATTIQRLGIQQVLHTTVLNALPVTFQKGTRTPIVSAATSLRMKARVDEFAAEARWQEEEEEEEDQFDCLHTPLHPQCCDWG
jgi:hypothetical protein